MPKYALVLLQLMLSGILWSQTPDTSRAPAAEVEAERIREDAPEIEYVHTPSTFDDLAFRLPISFRSGGLSDFATISVRGASVNQTKILWNGLPLNSALSGIADVSLLQNFWGDQISLYTSANGALQGDQAVGGVLSLTSQPDTTEGLHARVGGGVASYANYCGQLRLDYGRATTSYYLSLDYAQGLNDYYFPYPEDFFWLNPQNLNAKKQQGGIKFGFFIHKKKAKHELHYWHNRRMRELAPLVSSPSDSSSLRESFYRAVWKTSWQGARVQSESRLGFVLDDILYHNPKYNITADNRFAQYIWNTDHYYRRWHLLTEASYAQSLTDEQPSITQLSAAVAYSWPMGAHWRGSMAMRGVYFEGRTALVPSITSIYQLSHNWNWSVELGRVYRNPTLNELYYVPGGNPDLRAEQGWNTSTSLEHKTDGARPMRTTVSLYSRHVQDWVFWYGSLIFSPYNIGTVWSRGAELVSSYSLPVLGGIKPRLDVNLGWVRSTLSSTEDPYFEALEGAQLPYTPEWVTNLALILERGGFSTSIKNHYESARTATLNNTWVLEPFYLLDLELAYTLGLDSQGDKKVQFILGCKNVTNTYYQYIQSRPMPGRNFFMDVLLFL